MSARKDRSCVAYGALATSCVRSRSRARRSQPPFKRVAGYLSADLSHRFSSAAARRGVSCQHRRKSCRVSHRQDYSPASRRWRVEARSACAITPDAAEKCGPALAGDGKRALATLTSLASPLALCLEELHLTRFEPILGANDEQAVFLDQPFDNLRAVAQMINRCTDIGADSVSQQLVSSLSGIRFQ